MKNYSAKLKIIFGFLVAILIFSFLIFIFSERNGVENEKNLNQFAQCLTNKGYVMYGAYWCPHCKNEKRAFGDSFRFVSYVECPDEPNRCVEAGIQGYPTWIGPSNTFLEGEQGVMRLSEISGCALNGTYGAAAD